MKCIRPILVVALIITVLSIIAQNSFAQELHKKSELDVNVFSRLQHTYSLKDNNFIDEINENTSDQFLDKDLLFKKFFIKHQFFNDLLVQFNSKELVQKFKGQNVDVFGVYYGHKCQGGEPDKTACMYGGLTQTLNNRYENPINVPVNLWIDGEKKEVPLDTIKTRKKEVTIQELDAQIRKYLDRTYKIYDVEGQIQRGLITYHSTESTSYDIYDIKGKHAEEYLRFYSDNKTTSSNNTHLDVQLYSN